MAHKGIRGLYKRGRIWHMAYTVTLKREDGTEYTKTLRKSTGKTKMGDAEKILDDRRRDVDHGNYVPEERRVTQIPHPWDVTCDSYLEDRIRRGKRAESYRKLVAWREAFGTRDVTTITLNDVETQLAIWKDAVRPTKNGRSIQWSPATYNNALATVSGLFSFAYQRGWIDRHPLKGRAERMAVANERERYFYPHEIAAMRKTAEALARLRRQPRTWLSDLILGAAFTGLRRGDLCSLRCHDVFRDERDDLYLHVGLEKNGSPISKRLVGELRGIVEQRLEGRTPGSYLFPGADDGYAYSSMGRNLRTVVEHVGKHHPKWDLRWGMGPGGVTTHSFRHSFASIMLNAGAPMDVVQKAGGWRNPSQVKVYARRVDEAVRNAENNLAAVLSFHTTSQSEHIVTPTDSAYAKNA